MSEMLREVRRYEELEGRAITQAERPAFHLSCRVGWMNDPNGFSFYKGKYHMFYQYHPYNIMWGPCTGDTLCLRTFCTGNIFLRSWRPMNLTICIGAYPEALSNCRTGGIC